MADVAYFVFSFIGVGQFISLIFIAIKYQADVVILTATDVNK